LNIPVDTNTQQQIEALLSSGVNLPPQPKVLLEIEAQASKPNVSMRSIAQLLSNDAGLTARIFKVIHSPLFGLRREVDSLDQALSMMGLQSALAVVKSAALRDSIGGDAQAMDVFWDRANDIAILAAIIAKKQRALIRVSPEHAHMVGLFHDCGVPILMQRIPGYCANLVKAWPDLLEEDNQYKTSHAVAGYMMARNWKLPDAVCQTIRYHHESINAPEEEHAIISLLLMATHMRDLYCGYGDPAWSSMERAVLEELGLSVAGKGEFVDDVLNIFQDSLQS